MIKLTNASEGFLDNVIYLNPSHIVSVFTADDKTLIFGAGSTWTVMESLEDVIDLINGVKKAKPFGLYNGEPIKTEEELTAIMKSANL